MKFLKHEHDDMQKLMRAHGFDPDSFHFVKRKGHLYVQCENRSDEFCFFRKKETILDDQLQWQEKVTFYLDSGNKICVTSWRDVLVAFEKWLLKERKKT